MKKQAILCVDDDITILESLKVQLQSQFSQDFIIETAESAEEALDTVSFLAKRKITTLLVITDWLMPNMKGDELLLKIHDTYPDISTIMLSGQADERAIEKAYEQAKMSLFMAKPWDKEKLLEAVTTLLNAKRNLETIITD